MYKWYFVIKRVCFVKNNISDKVEMSLTPELLKTVINNLWSIYGKTEEDFKLRDAFTAMLDTTHTFWVMKHITQHCDHHNWWLVVGIANDPIDYYNCLTNESVHLYNKGYII
jgi:hypothetical protein